LNPVAFNIFGIGIRWYGIFIATAMLIGTLLAIRESRRIGFDENYIMDIILFSVPAAIVGARLYYVAFEWNNYKYNLLEIFATRNGGLAIHGGIIGAVIAATIYTRIKKINFLIPADICAPGIILGQAIGRWGNFMNQEAYGGPVSKEFISHFPKFIQNQMFINGTYYNPTFLYESIWDLLIFLFLIMYRRKPHKNGYIFLFYLLLYSIGRYFIEGLRTDSLMIGHFRIAQLLSLGLIIFSILSIYIIKFKNNYKA
jgi:phosphatidylglycerol---prolipoprotein diacylglyceryl transferase